MNMNGGSSGAGQGQQIEKTYFESQREMLVLEIAQSLEHVLQNINKLNRSLEEVIAVGNEFSPVEALWSQFENVMAKQGGEEGGAQGQGQGQGQEQHGDEGRTEHEGETEVEREG